MLGIIYNGQESTVLIVQLLKHGKWEMFMRLVYPDLQSHVCLYVLFLLHVPSPQYVQ
ncbi:hypothetical protein HanIR_Chr11g0508201 [Helianthus annuus]|nr:hypothetical protein HanIR_Chr11g0508201 [Helianthus annuus]